ncbi:hypothetical protein LPB140_02300 [Sphingorhabdus lutea]|uniref:TonB C-terminal domain-containing protein n=1 Tax=Sphingorhabdus lutea TaxID=1913578 RepID=A0A1L3J9Q5_9SPHN|nr:energy transducer TonB [Sphingorhabdus lutea]APG61850.1 hypothetical protein LPB140_02300 [Sphingorhabdus lutea]
MSYATYNNGTNFKAMGLALGINGAIIAAAILIPSAVYFIKKEPRTTVINVENKPDQPPPPVEDFSKEKPAKADPIYIQKPINPAPKNDNDVTTTPEKPTAQPLPTGGVIDGSAPIKPTETIIKPADIPLPLISARRDPKYASRFQPEYPGRLIRLGIEGSATISVLIGTDGRVKIANIVSATHVEFGRAAREQALKSWRFIPARRGDIIVEEWMILPVNFILN